MAIIESIIAKHVGSDGHVFFVIHKPGKGYFVEEDHVTSMNQDRYGMGHLLWYSKYFKDRKRAVEVYKTYIASRGYGNIKSGSASDIIHTDNAHWKWKTKRGAIYGK